MNRIKDYGSFAAWFAGLGYIVLWPVTAADFGGKPFGASMFCRDSSLALLDLLCNSERLLKMPSGLHALGFMSAAFVTTRLLWSGIQRSRRGAPVKLAPPLAGQMDVPPPPRRPPPLRHTVKPRTHFGLRGVQH